MQRVISILVIALLATSCAQAPTTVTSAKAQEKSATVEVKIIAFNDFHGNLKTPSLRVAVPDATQSTGLRFDPAGGIEQFSAVVQALKAKNKNFAVVSAGDMIGATPLLSAFFKDEPTIEAMNLVGIDFHAVGNHEFDYGVKHLKRLRNGGQAGFQLRVAQLSQFLANRTDRTHCGQTLLRIVIVFGQMLGDERDQQPVLVRSKGFALQQYLVESSRLVEHPSAGGRD